MISEKEVKEIGDRLLRFPRLAKQSPEMREDQKRMCKEELALAEVLIASKFRLSPLDTRSLFRKHLPQEVADLIGGENE